MKFSIKDFFSFLRIWSHLLKKSFMENFIFLCSVKRGSELLTSNWFWELDLKTLFYCLYHSLCSRGQCITQQGTGYPVSCSKLHIRLILLKLIKLASWIRTTIKVRVDSSLNANHFCKTCKPKNKLLHKNISSLLTITAYSFAIFLTNGYLFESALMFVWKQQKFWHSEKYHIFSFTSGSSFP